MQDISIQKEQPAGQNDDSVNTAELSFHAALCNQIAQLYPFRWRQKGKARNASIYVAAAAVAGFKPFSQRHKVTLQVWSRGFLLRASINQFFFFLRIGRLPHSI